MNDESLSIVVPVYNEEAIIEKMLRDYHAEIAGKFKKPEIIVVNDCSTDNSREILEGLKKELGLIIIDLPKNLGHGAALCRGLEEASGDLVFHTDSDYQHDPKDFWKLYQNIKDYDAVIGYRENRQDNYIRKKLSDFISIFNRLLFGVSLKDANSPFKLYRKKVLDSILPHVNRGILAPSIFINLQAYRMGCKIKEVPVAHYRRQSGRSSLLGWQLIKFCLVSLLQLIKFRALTQRVRAGRLVIFLFLVLLMQFALRIPYLNEPLQYDEGVYGYMAQRILEGEMPYRDYFDHKPPAVYYTYASIIKFFGSSVFSIRLATAVFGLLTTIFVFLIAQKIFSSQIGLLAALLYGLFSGGAFIQGASSNTESFMVLFMVMGLYCFTLGRFMNRPYMIFPFLAGLFYGIAFMFKQVALLSFLPLLFFAGAINALILCFGFLICPLLFVLYFSLNGALFDFINFAFIFNTYYADWSGIVSKFALIRLLQIGLYENSVIWLFAAIGSILILLNPGDDSNRRLLLLWTLFSFIGVAASGYYFDHYFIQIIPGLCLLSAYAFVRIIESRGRKFGKAVIFTIAFILGLNIIAAQYNNIYRGTKTGKTARLAAEKLKKYLKKEDKIAARGFPQIYFYTGAKYPGKFFYGVPSCTVDVYSSVNVFNLFKIKDFRHLPGRMPSALMDWHSADLTSALASPQNKFAVQAVNPNCYDETAVNFYALNRYKYFSGSADCYIFSK